jgi:DNA-binding PadR family transcriptional regulator
MNGPDILNALGEADKPLGAMEIGDEVARQKGYGRVRKFLFCNSGSIYPELATLERGGFVEGRFAEGPHPRRQLYSLTILGVAWYTAHYVPKQGSQ